MESPPPPPPPHFIFGFVCLFSSFSGFYQAEPTIASSSEMKLQLSPPGQKPSSPLKKGFLFSSDQQAVKPCSSTQQNSPPPLFSHLCKHFFKPSSYITEEQKETQKALKGCGGQSSAEGLITQNNLWRGSGTRGTLWLLGYYSTYFPLEWNATAAPESGGGRGSLFFSQSERIFAWVALLWEEEEGVRGRRAAAAAAAAGPPLLSDFSHRDQQSK